MKNRVHILCSFSRGIVAAAVALILLTGCRRSEFSISIQLPPDIWGNYHISYYASDGNGGLWINQTAPLEEGKFVLKGASRQATPVYITDNRNNEVLFFVSPGDKLELTGENAEPALWNAKGNSISESLAAFRHSELKDSLARYIETHPDLPASALLLLTEFPRREKPEEFVRLWNSLGAKSDRKQIAAIAGTPDLGPLSPFRIEKDGKLVLRGAKARISSLAVKTPDGWNDTIRTAGKPSILYFYKRESTEGTTAVDSMRVLVKDYPDSSLRNIALLSFFPDSATWRTRAAKDSLHKVLRGWIPGGETDRRMQALGVATTPWFIIIDSKGNQVYRGSDLTEAMKNFRVLPKAKENKN